jgi:hypothetical protein
MIDYQSLLTYAKSERQNTILQACIAEGSNQKAAKALQVTRQVVDECVRRTTKYAAQQGFAPAHGMTKVAPSGFTVKGVSTLYNADGDISAQWVKTDRDLEQQRELQKEFIESLAQDIKGLAKPVLAPKIGLEDVLSQYVIGDAHFGLRSWHPETLEADFDLAIAERELKAAISYLVQSAPKGREAHLVDVGDFLHVDNQKQQTPQSGNLLDVDTRYQKLIRITVMTFRYAIEQLLRKHEIVRIYVTPGNHNPDSAGWIALALDMFYENEPRVFVETSPAAFFYYKWGNNLFGITHGDRVKLPELPSIMAADMPKEWGQTEHRYWLTGHIHHTRKQEYRGCFVESFNTLAPNDAWHTKSGYRSLRQMTRVDYHREHGEYSRQPVKIGMLNLGSD